MSHGRDVEWYTLMLGSWGRTVAPPRPLSPEYTPSARAACRNVFLFFPWLYNTTGAGFLHELEPVFVVNVDLTTDVNFRYIAGRRGERS